MAMRDGLPVARSGLVSHEQAGALELCAVWVAPEARGTGTSDMVVRAALDWARDSGYREIRLWVRENNKPANDLYTRLGFTPTGQQKPRRTDSSLADIEMRHEFS
ncbi:GNAT family N-acetyltransferase [Nocardia asteroides]|nr:GNAT family N-acetyltransferase [Nocardia asteroides]